MQERIKKITKMEHILNHTDKLISNLEILLQRWEENNKEFQELMDYYSSEERNQDLEDDRLHLIPQDLPRGVLSEDAIYNTYGHRKDLSIRMIKLGVDGLEKF